MITADASKIRSSNFKTNRKTHFVVHGFTDKGEDNWLSDICKVRAGTLPEMAVADANCPCTCKERWWPQHREASEACEPGLSREREVVVVDTAALGQSGP